MSQDVLVKSYTPKSPPAVNKAIKEVLERLEKADFIEPLISPYLYLTMCATKPDGSSRVIIDFRLFNKNL